jgi:N-carbamoyl-L-amino-acid hydrolase
MSLTLDRERLLEQLRQLGALGADPVAGGRTRIALTDADRAGRDLLVTWMRELNLDIRIDRIGNIFGSLHSDSDDGHQRPLMIGSHIDTVKNAGGPRRLLWGAGRPCRRTGVSPSGNETGAFHHHRRFYE